MFAPNPFLSQCPTRRVLDRIGDKWAVLVLIQLRAEAKRFNTLRRAIEGVSQKMLSQTLKSLERDGLISRTAWPTVPVTVEYATTPLGATLVDTVDALRLWAEAHTGDVEKAQQRYDASIVRPLFPLPPAGQRTPPDVGARTPVVVGNVSGRPSRLRTAK